MGDIDFSISSILISSFENAVFCKYVFASLVYVLEVCYILSVCCLYSSAKTICLYSQSDILFKILLCMQYLMQT